MQFKLLAALAATAFLVACGGGGDDAKKGATPKSEGTTAKKEKKSDLAGWDTLSNERLVELLFADAQPARAVALLGRLDLLRPLCPRLEVERGAPLVVARALARTEAGEFQAHAWTELDGVKVVGFVDEEYRALPDFQAALALTARAGGVVDGPPAPVPTTTASAEIASVEVAGPGFINFTIAESARASLPTSLRSSRSVMNSPLRVDICIFFPPR